MIPDPAPPLQRFGGAVLLQGIALRNTFLLCAIGLSKLETAGNRKAADYQRELVAELERATRENQQERHDDVAVTPIPASCLVDTAGAAEILGCSRRHVQRIARSLNGQRTRPGSVWAFDRRVVAAYREGDAAA